MCKGKPNHRSGSWGDASCGPLSTWELSELTSDSLGLLPHPVGAKPSVLGVGALRAVPWRRGCSRPGSPSCVPTAHVRVAPASLASRPRGPPLWVCSPSVTSYGVFSLLFGNCVCGLGSCIRSGKEQVPSR